MAKILLVDDDLDFVEINRALLEKQGYQVVAGRNPKDGMDLLKKEMPDLLILDVMMEEADDGFAMAQRIRKEGNRIPIILLTSLARITGQIYGKDSTLVPVDEFLEKPVSGEKLLRAVRKFAGKRGDRHVGG